MVAWCDYLNNDSHILGQMLYNHPIGTCNVLFKAFKKCYKCETYREIKRSYHLIFFLILLTHIYDWSRSPNGRMVISTQYALFKHIHRWRQKRSAEEYKAGAKPPLFILPKPVSAFGSTLLFTAMSKCACVRVHVFTNLLDWLEEIPECSSLFQTETSLLLKGTGVK